MGTWKRRSSSVETPSRASASARCGPTPLTYCTGEARSIAAIIPRRPAAPVRRGGSELEDGLAGLDAHAAHGVRQAEGRVDVEAVGMLVAPGGRLHHLLEQADGHADGGHVHRIPFDGAEP